MSEPEKKKKLKLKIKSNRKKSPKKPNVKRKDKSVVEKKNNESSDSDDSEWIPDEHIHSHSDSEEYSDMSEYENENLQNESIQKIIGKMFPTKSTKEKKEQLEKIDKFVKKEKNKKIKNKKALKRKGWSKFFLLQYFHFDRYNNVSDILLKSYQHFISSYFSSKKASFSRQFDNIVINLTS